MFFLCWAWNKLLYIIARISISVTVSSALWKQSSFTNGCWGHVWIFAARSRKLTDLLCTWIVFIVWVPPGKWRKWKLRNTFTVSLFICGLNIKAYDWILFIFCFSSILFHDLYHFSLVFMGNLFSCNLIQTPIFPSKSNLHCTVTPDKPAVYTNNSLFSLFHVCS